MSGYQILFHSDPVPHIPVTKCSDLTVPLVDAEVNKLLLIGAIKAIPFSKENFYSRLFLVPKKEGNLPPCNRPQPAQQVCTELPFSNSKHFLSEDTSKKGRLYDTHRPKRMHISSSTYTSPHEGTCVSIGETDVMPSEAYHLG